MNKTGIWFPETHQIVILNKSDNKGFTNYFRSVWIGITAMPLNLPGVIYVTFCAKGFSWFFVRFFMATMWVMFVTMPVVGFAGCLNSISASPEELLKKRASPNV